MSINIDEKVERARTYGRDCRPKLECSSAEARSISNCKLEPEAIFQYVVTRKLLEFTTVHGYEETCRLIGIRTPLWQGEIISEEGFKAADKLGGFVAACMDFGVIGECISTPLSDLSLGAHFNGVLDYSWFCRQSLEHRTSHLKHLVGLTSPFGVAAICIAASATDASAHGPDAISECEFAPTPFDEKDARRYLEGQGFTWIASLRAPLTERSTDKFACFVGIGDQDAK